MINSFKKGRTKTKTTGWGINTLDHDKLVNNKLLDNGTICQLFLLKCPWYYNFKNLYHDHPNIIAPYMIEFRGPDCRVGREVSANRDDDEIKDPDFGDGFGSA